MSNLLDSNLGALAVASTPTQDIYAAIDAGSTQTRGAVFTKSGQMRAPLLVDSNYDVISRDISHVASPGSNVYSNLELQIEDITAEKSEKQFEKITVIKGDLLASITSSRQITTSAASKIDQVATYINIVSNVALLLLDYYVDNGTQDIAQIHLVTSLPPEDTRFKRRTDLFRGRLAGDYKVDMPRLGVSISFRILDDFKILSEPEAVAVYAAVEGVLTDEDDSVVCVMDIGGRSTGITFIDNKKLLIDSCATVPIGGSRLLGILSRDIANTYDIQEPPVSRLFRALTTGYFKIGANKIDISQQLNSAKQEFSEMIFNELLVAIDMNNIQMQNISKVYCSGRTFGAAEMSPSIVTNLEKLFKVKSPYTEFRVVDKPNPILTGLVYNGIMYA